MPDSRDRLSTTTIALHWLLAAAIIAMIPFGWYVEDLPRSIRDGPLGLHAAIGITILVVAILRILWRAAQGFPSPVGRYARWETVLAKAVHWILLIATVAMPVSGMMMILGDGRAIDVFGLFGIGPVVAAPVRPVTSAAHVIHGLGSNILILAIVLHVAGAVKHHAIDRDGTLKRMFGHRVAPAD